MLEEMKSDILISKIQKLRNQQRKLLLKGDLEEYRRVEAIIEEAVGKLESLTDERIRKIGRKNDIKMNKIEDKIEKRQQVLNDFFDSYDKMEEEFPVKKNK